MTTVICFTRVCSVLETLREKEALQPLEGRDWILLLMGAHQTKVFYLNFAHLIRKVSFALVQVHRALLKASLQALGEILQHLSIRMTH